VGGDLAKGGDEPVDVAGGGGEAEAGAHGARELGVAAGAQLAVQVPRLAGHRIHPERAQPPAGGRQRHHPDHIRRPRLITIGRVRPDHILDRHQPIAPPPAKDVQETLLRVDVSGDPL
jgi:hypothetical protein